MAARRPPDHSAEQMRAMYRYDDGHLLWATEQYHARWGHLLWSPGDEVTTYLNPSGYRYVQVGKRFYLLHRVVWAISMGEWPPLLADIDHIDGNKQNNRRENLRIASRSQNKANVALTKRNTSGYKGVSLTRGGSKWTAMIRLDGRTLYIGTYDKPEDAAAAYLSRAKELFGEFACGSER